MPSPSFALTVALVLVASSSGCDHASDKAPSPLPPASPSAAAPAAPSVETAKPASANADGSAKIAPAPVLTTIPEARSKVPTSAEWKAARELTGPTISVQQECQVHLVREWLRLTCRKTTKSPSGNNQLFFDIHAVTVEEGRDSETFTFVGKDNDVGSVVVPLVRGKRRRAVIAYDVATVTVALVVDWPAGAAAPTVSVRE